MCWYQPSLNVQPPLALLPKASEPSLRGRLALTKVVTRFDPKDRSGWRSMQKIARHISHKVNGDILHIDKAIELEQDPFISIRNSVYFMVEL